MNKNYADVNIKELMEQLADARTEYGSSVLHMHPETLKALQIEANKKLPGGYQDKANLSSIKFNGIEIISNIYLAKNRAIIFDSERLSQNIYKDLYIDPIPEETIPHGKGSFIQRIIKFIRRLNVWERLKEGRVR